MIYGECKSNEKIDEENMDLLSQFNCKENEHNPLATMFVNEEVGSIRSIMPGFDGPGGIRIPAH